MVTLVANGPSSIRGQAESEVADPPGSVSPLSVLMASKDTSITAFAVVTNLFSTGDSAYEIEFTCGQSNGGVVQPKDIKLLQDQ